MSFFTRYQRHRRRFQACQTTPEQLRSEFVRALQAIAVAATFMFTLGTAAVFSGMEELFVGARVGYFTIAGYGLLGLLRMNLDNLGALGRAMRTERAHTRRVWRRWRRMKRRGML